MQYLSGELVCFLLLLGDQALLLNACGGNSVLPFEPLQGYCIPFWYPQSSVSSLPSATPPTGSQANGLIDSFREESTGHTSVACQFWGLDPAEQDHLSKAHFFFLQAEWK